MGNVQKAEENAIYEFQIICGETRIVLNTPDIEKITHCPTCGNVIE